MITDNHASYLPMTESETAVLAQAESILLARLRRVGILRTPTDVASFLRMRLGALEHEEFHVLWLDTRHQVLDVEGLFRGTVDGASVYPREVVKAALRVNAAACVLAHNHPSGNTEPSMADHDITRRIKEALALIDVRVVDHVVVSAGGATSMMLRGLI